MKELATLSKRKLKNGKEVYRIRWWEDGTRRSETLGHCDRIPRAIQVPRRHRIDGSGRSGCRGVVSGGGRGSAGPRGGPVFLFLAADADAALGGK